MLPWGAKAALTTHGEVFIHSQKTTALHLQQADYELLYRLIRHNKNYTINFFYFVRIYINVCKQIKLQVAYQKDEVL